MGEQFGFIGILLAARSHSASSDDNGIGYIIFGVLTLILIIVSAAVVKRDPNKWYGKMSCTKCGYQWDSRRNTPPARCPKCRSNSIRPVNG